MSKPNLDVAIIGAGPVGMALASELIRHGLSVRIIDKAPEPKNYSRAPVFWPRAQEALDLMGIHHLWDGRTVPMTHMHLNIYGHPAGTVELAKGKSAHPVPMMVGQDVTERILDQNLTDLGTPVERSTEATAVKEIEGGMSISIRRQDKSEETFEASWVVGCDGPKSLVREATGLPWEGHLLKGMMVPIADAKVKWPLSQAEGHAYVGLSDKGYFLALPLPGLQRIIISIPDTTPEGESPEMTLDEVAELASEIIGGPVEMWDSPWVTVARYGNHMVPTMRKGRALLAGDAAHSIAPLSGQGMNVGVQDTFDLAWKLSYVHKGWAPDALLDSFTADRRPNAEHLLHATDSFFKNSNNTGAAHKLLFGTIAPLAMHINKVGELAAAFYTEVNSLYPNSPLNDTSHHHSPKPGEHVQDGVLVRWPDMEQMRLYDAIRGLHWSALIFTGSDPSAETFKRLQEQISALTKVVGDERLHPTLIVGAPKPPASLGASELAVALDAWSHLHEEYEASKDGALVLVRPDGYVSFHRGAGDKDFKAATEHLCDKLGDIVLGDLQ